MYKLWSLLSLVLLAACSSDKDDSACADDGVYRDGDGDGYIDEHEFDGCASVPAALVDRLGDCRDTDPDVHPGAEDIPGDGIDQDCDGQDATAAGTEDSGGDTGEDTGGEVTDSDHDGAPDGEDCDDDDNDAFPGAVETCDGTDNDCDGEIDEDAADASTWCADTDGDGYGDPAVSVVACDAPSGDVADCSDTDDSNSSIYPGSAAVDDDGDGYSDDAGDCDDGSSAVSPGATEIPYDGIDQDCSGADLTDVDGDGADAVAAGGDDPDDTDASIYVGSSAYDDDGDGESDDEGDCDDTDPSITSTTDGDGDGSLCGEDCDDADSDIFPGAWERCDGVDNDCDGSIDEDLDYRKLYPDSDGDGYGSAAGAVVACDLLDGYVVDDSDCDDADPAIHPGASEYCNGVDDDCDGSVDNDPEDPSLWYSPDADGDGYATSDSGDFTWTWTCDRPEGYAASTGDCDDDYALAYPGAPEVCDGTRNDCDESSAWWTAHATEEEAGLVSFIADDGDELTDWTAEAALGADGAPADITLTADGALNFCADSAGSTWFVAITADNVSVSISGLQGSELTTLSGGGVDLPVDLSNTTAEVSGLTIRDGYSSKGGGLSASLSTLTLSDTVFAENTAYGSTYYNDSALALSLSTVSLDTVAVTDTASTYAIGAYVSDVTAAGLIVDRNDHNGVYLYASATSIVDSEITDNAEGGLVILAGGETALERTVVRGNNRGLYATQGGKITLSDSTFQDNGYASSGGGALYIYYSGDVTATDTVFDSNHSAAGGAFYLNGAAILTLQGSGSCEVKNDVDSYANAAYLGSSWSGTLTSDGCTWADGQDIRIGVSDTTVDTDTLSDPFTCTSTGCY